MELFSFESVGAYQKAMLRRYVSAPHFIDNKSGILKIISNPRGAFFRNSVQKMVGIREKGAVLCQCILIKHKNSDALAIAFFEAEPDAGDAVCMMMAHAADFAKSAGASRMVAALDGHCNYSIGFSCGEWQSPPLFGESHNPAYYHAYFEGWSKRGFSNYYGDYDEIARKIEALWSRIGDRTLRIETQCIHLKAFQKEMRRYTDLSNRIFDGHWYYSPREYEEDYELFRSMKPLLSPYNIIFAVKDGMDVGYIVLYPDFNQLVPVGKGANTGTYLRHKLLGAAPSDIKIAEIAVLEEYRNTGAILTLFAEGCRQIKQRYPQASRVVSSWIADENQASGSITKRFAPNLYRSYAAYETAL